MHLSRDVFFSAPKLVPSPVSELHVHHVCVSLIPTDVDAASADVGKFFAQALLSGKIFFFGDASDKDWILAHALIVPLGISFRRGGERGRGRGRGRGDEPKEKWVPVTKLGRLVQGLCKF